MLKVLFNFLALFFAATVSASTIDVNEFLYAGPFIVNAPVLLDSVDVNSKPFSLENILDTYIDLSKTTNGERRTLGSLPRQTPQMALHLIEFDIKNEAFTTASIDVKGIQHNKIFIDGSETNGKNVQLTPASHKVVIKYATNQEEPLIQWGITVDADTDRPITINTASKRDYQLSDVLHCWRYSGIELSPSGNYLIVSYSTMDTKGKTQRKTSVMRLKDGMVIDRTDGVRWMPKSDKYYFINNTFDGRTITTVDPETHQVNVFAKNIPEGNITVAPSEDYLIIQYEVEGPKHDKDIYQVSEPDDRQPGFRNRLAIAIHDLKTEMTSPLTFGPKSAYVMDISQDGTKFLVGVTKTRLQRRPTTITDYVIIDKNTFKVDTLVKDEGFVSNAQFSPDARRVLFVGSPEALGGVGNILPADKTPSMIDNQLFIMDLNTKSVRPMTRHFNPNVTSVKWSKADEMIYFNAEDKDCVNLFRLNPDNGKINRIVVDEELVSRFDVAENSDVMVFYGQSASNSDRLYTIDLKKMKPTLVEDLSKETLKDIQLGECKAWDYINQRGDTICCRYYLPADFNPTKKYPMIVNYYGGCSPTSRNFESRYPQHAYASQGYVVLVINPSGATGFGQEFASRHVNTAGEGVAEDIIGATKKFTQEHQFVNPAKIGCIGASYGGFMTQYLQIQTDIFAAAISHAGISDHTSYWGEGYWGYSYSEVSMANSYPWTDKKLYVEQSPLYNADKVNTPILFLHGTNDNNVPVGESIQMFTALKLLGKETAMVLVDGQDHHILDMNKRIKWQNTIFAWFAKYLQDEPNWWKSIYKEPR